MSQKARLVIGLVTGGRRGSCVSGFHCGAIAIAIGIGVGIAATFTRVIASHCVGATVDFDTDTDLDENPKAKEPPMPF